MVRGEEREEMLKRNEGWIMMKEVKEGRERERIC